MVPEGILKGLLTALLAALLAISPSIAAAQTPPPLPPTPPPLPQPPAQYFYADNGKPAGPVTLDEIKAKIAAGIIKPDTLVWKVGMPSWVAAKDQGDIAPIFASAQKPLPSPVLVPQLGRSANVRSVAFSPDGRLLALGCEDETIKLWDTASGRELRMLEGGQGKNTISLAFSPDGRMIAETVQHYIQLWDASGRSLFALTGHRGWVVSLAFSPDGRTIVSSDRLDLKLWDVESGRELPALEDADGIGDSVAFSPDGRIIASVAAFGIRLWDVASRRVLRNLKTNTMGSDSIAFSPDGRMLASGGFPNDSIKLWDVASGRELRTLKGDEFLQSMVFSPDGSVIALSGREITLLDVTSGRELRTLKGHLPAFSPDGRLLVAGSYDRTAKIWDAASGRLFVTMFADTENWAAFTPDNLFVTSGDPKQMFKLMRGDESLPMDEFIAANRRDSLSEALTPH